MVALPVLNCGCVTPASDGGTGAGAMAGPTSGPRGTTPIGGGVGGGKGGTPAGLPISGGGMIGMNSGKLASVGLLLIVSSPFVQVVVASAASDEM